MPRKRIAYLVSKLDVHMLDVFSGTIVAIAVRIVGVGLTFILNLFIARLLGAEGAGIYFMALSMTTIFSIVAQCGLTNSVLRFVASSVAMEDWKQVKGVFSQSILVVVGSSLTLVFLVIIGADLIAENLFREPSLSVPLRYMSVGILTLSVMVLLAESLKGLKQILNSMLLTSVYYPLITVSLLWPLTKYFGPAGASLAYVSGTGGAALIGVLLWKKSLRSHTEKGEFSMQRLWASCRPLWFSTLITQALLPLAPLLLLGMMGDATEAGIFAVTTRIANLVTFLLAATNTILAPKFAELYSKGDLNNLKLLAKRFSLIITLITSPLILVLVLANGWVLGLFGAEFIGGGTALYILIVGQTVNALTGPVGALLMMSGHEQDIKKSAIFAAAAMIIFALIFIPLFGIIGAALSSAAAIIVMEFSNSLYVWHRLKINIFPLAK